MVTMAHSKRCELAQHAISLIETDRLQFWQLFVCGAYNNDYVLRQCEDDVEDAVVWELQPLTPSAVTQVEEATQSVTQFETSSRSTTFLSKPDIAGSGEDSD